MFSAIEEMTFSRERMFLAIGRIILAIGKTILAIENMILAMRKTILSIEKTILAIEKMILSIEEIIFSPVLAAVDRRFYVNDRDHRNRNGFYEAMIQCSDDPMIQSLYACHQVQ
jgi:hypothetical protein